MTGTMTDAPRLDVWLAQQRNITRHAARTLIDAGLVTVNGRPARPGQRIRGRDAVVVTELAGPAAAGSPARLLREPPPRQRTGEPPVVPWVPGSRPSPATTATFPLTIIYEDEWLAVVDKPAGMVVHPAPGHAADTLADALKARGSTWSLLGGAERAGIVHRLDRDTSGLLVVAKTEAAHRGLAAQLRERTLGRAYWVVVHGGLREETGTIDAPIGRDPRNRKRMAVVDSGRRAITDFTVVERLGDATLLEVRLRTGRTHQVRVHMAYIRHPVVGDPVYGRAHDFLTRPALHATRLRFIHPGDGTPRTFDSPPPPELAGYLDALRERHKR